MMKASKKDFRAFAKVLRDNGRGSSWHRALVIAIADILRESNPSFDYERFLDAVYEEDES
jgi:hypothetical protein